MNHSGGLPSPGPAHSPTGSGIVTSQSWFAAAACRGGRGGGGGRGGEGGKGREDRVRRRLGQPPPRAPPRPPSGRGRGARGLDGRARLRGRDYARGPGGATATLPAGARRRRGGPSGCRPATAAAASRLPAARPQVPLPRCAQRCQPGHGIQHAGLCVSCEALRQKGDRAAQETCPRWR